MASENSMSIRGEEEDEEGDVVVVHMVDMANTNSAHNTSTLRKSGLNLHVLLPCLSRGCTGYRTGWIIRPT
jgi:hypothetical protein